MLNRFCLLSENLTPTHPVLNGQYQAELNTKQN